MIKNTAYLTILNLISNAASAVFGLFLAYYFGASPEMDGYIVGSNVILGFSTIFNDAQLRTFIPFITKFQGRPEQKDIIASLIRFNFLTFFLVGAALIFLSKWVATSFAPGLTSEQLSLASKIIKIMAFFLLLTNFCGVVGGLMRINRHYVLTGILSFLQAASALILLSFLVKQFGIFGPSIAHISAFLIVFVGFLIYYLRTGFSFKSSLSLWNTYLAQYYKLMLPLFISAFFVFSIRFADTFIASFYDSGNLSHLGYCQRMSRSLGILPTALLTIFFPLLSKLNQEKDNQAFLNLFYKGVEATFAATFSLAIFVFIFSYKIVALIFQRGSFTDSDTESVGALLRYFILVLICAPLGAFLASTYYSRQRVWLAVMLSFISSMVNLILNVTLGLILAVKGLALASSLAFLLGNFLQLFFLKRVVTTFEIKRVWISLKPVITTGSVVGILFFWASRTLFFAPSPSFVYNFCFLLISFVLFYGLFLGLALTLKSNFAVALRDFLIKKA